ncbi:S1 RNA-binding domain-containing protein [Virgibacillus xinjiangensis]|uniref:S1 RNA-binding domain-containing protein n=1 Tax=Virgibacillus xinjiangensis TaxID=393090 RepID=A0ABV7CTJ2_9BACI
MDHLQSGTIQSMAVERKIDTGYVLMQDGSEALLHHNETEQELEPGDTVDVFLYPDKKGQIIASAKLPHVVMDAYGWTEVVEVLPHLGAFVDIGTTKEILVSKDDLPLFEKVWPQPGDKLFVTLGRDKKGRLLAIPATEGVIAREVELAPEELLNQTVSGTVYHTSKEGSAILTDDDYRGFIHHTERKEEPRLGEYVEGRVIEVKTDGTLNISLRPLKQHSMGEDADEILAFMQEQDGRMAFTDKSDPEDIRGTFQISKAAFKRALGRLMKEGKIEQRDGYTYLKED